VGMEKILKLIYGYIIILVRGEYPERFLNLCRSRKIYMEKIQYKNNDQEISGA
jgi:similar to stage IV sporulation protein